ncbi:MAG TPA: hypothetical protein VL993_01240 [Stellaceae bacterium]|nr:hypothetical protein [Stellaceae bacterium]
MRAAPVMVLALSLFSWGAAAQQAPDAAPPLQPGRQGDIQFVSGGSSLDDREALRDVAGKYDVRLTFAVLPGRQYLSGVNVKLADSSGRTVLDTVSDGPLFYAAVPPGHYRLTVTNSGQAQTGEFSVAGNGVVSRAFFWRQAD